MSSTCHEVIGVGFGPGNLALAIALEELAPSVDARFAERDANAGWQAQMMLGRANIQHHPFIDLVTPRNPRSAYSFISYLHEKNLIFRHLNLGLEYPLRKEYARYIAWAAEKFAHQVDYGRPVASIAVERCPHDGAPAYRVTSTNGDELRGHLLVLATGRTPYVPPVFARARSERVVHLTRYLSQIERFAAAGGTRLAVVGASQSAVEILLHIAQAYPQLEVVSYLRHFAFRQKDTSPFMEASVFPEHIEPFYRASHEQKRRINEDLRYLNYSSADADVVKDLYLTLYEHDLDGRPRIEILNNRDITAVQERDGGLTIASRHTYTGASEERQVGLAILATGFRDLGEREEQEPIPPLLAPLAERFAHDERGVVRVNYDYSLDASAPDTPPLFLNGLCEASHGISDAGSFSLLSLRVEKLTNAILPHVDALRAGRAAREVLA